MGKHIALFFGTVVFIVLFVVSQQASFMIVAVLLMICELLTQILDEITKLVDR